MKHIFIINPAAGKNDGSQKNHYMYLFFVDKKNNVIYNII